MLSCLRVASGRALPRILTRHARSITTDRSSTPGDRVSNQHRQEALDVFSPNFNNPFEQAVVEEIPKPEIDLSTMHHHVPPAESPILQFLTTMIMRHGEYAKAQRVVSNMLLHIYAMTRSPPMPIVEQAVLKASPAVKCKKLKQRGGKSGLKPMALNERQRTSQALRWIREEVYGEKKNKGSMRGKGTPGRLAEQRLAIEMINIIKGTSSVLERKRKMHEDAMANRGSLSKR